MKYLLVLIVVGVGLWMLAARFRKPRNPHKPAQPGRDPSAGTPAGGETRTPSREGAGADKAVPGQMVACRHCGVHLPADEAVFDGQMPYCGTSHRQAGPR